MIFSFLSFSFFIGVSKKKNRLASYDFIDRINLERPKPIVRGFCCFVAQGIREYDSPKTIKPRLREARYSSTTRVCFAVFTGGFTVRSISFIADKDYYRSEDPAYNSAFEHSSFFIFTAAYDIVRKFRTQS